MTKYSDLCARYSGPIPPNALADALYGPYSARLGKVQGTLGELRPLARSCFRRLKSYTPDDPRRPGCVQELMGYYRTFHRLAAERDELIALRRAQEQAEAAE